MKPPQSKPIIDDVNPMYIHRYGQGRQPYLGLHGWAADHTTFAHLADHMPAHCTLSSVDLPGYGRSPHLPEWSIDALRQSLLSAIDACASDSPLTIIGSCSGAVLTLAALHRDINDLNISRLILLEPFAFVPDYLEIFTKPVIGKVAYWSTFCNPIGRAITDAVIKRQDIAQEHGTSDSFSKVDPWVPYHYLHLMAQLGQPEQFAHLSCDIDMIVGQNTFEAIHQSVEIWQSVWQQATSYQLPEVGHMLIQEAPQLLAKTIFRTIS